jgi:intracellular sulfur oxidation DsrE/DsrF family protein
VFDATRGPDAPERLLPALDNAGSELNAIAASGFPLSNAQFAIVFHGDAVSGILSDEHYKEKFGVANPNLPVLEQMEKAGVELVVCGQFLAAEHIDPHTLSPRVKVGSDALLALMDFQEKGYALLSF